MVSSALGAAGYQEYAGSVMPREVMSNQSDNETNDSTGDEAREHTREVVRVHQTRLRVLELQAAKLGDYVPPHILTEINDIQTEIAHLKAELNATTPPIARSHLRQLRQQALKAYYTQKWAQAEELFSQVLQLDLNDTDVQAKLEEVQRQLTLQAAYQLICELRNADQWQPALDALDDLERLQPNYPGAAELREWAEGRKERAKWYAGYVEMYRANQLSMARNLLETILLYFPEDIEAQEKLAQVLADLEREDNVYRATIDDAPSIPPELRITIALEQEYLKIAPGQLKTLDLSIMSLSNCMEYIHIKVEGVPQDWVETPEPITLLPGALEHIQLSIDIPKEPESRSGEYLVLFRAVANSDPNTQGIAQSKWEVLPFFESKLEIKPKKVRGRWEGNSAINIANMGNTIQSYTLAVEDDEDMLEFIFNEGQIVVLPGQVETIRLTVRPRERIWIGRASMYNFNVRCRSQDGTEQVIIASFVSQAVIAG